MKALARAILLVAALPSECGAEATRYGPAGCVSVRRSPAGSCVLATDCPGVSLSNFEFAFDCESADGSLVRHSFGRGGFDANEEFDTEVQCRTCTPPQGPEPPLPSSDGQLVVPTAVPLAVQLVGTRGLATAMHSLVARKVGSEASTGAKANAKVSLRSYAASKSEPDELPAVVRYGPNSCVSTYRSQEGHCIMQTKCTEADIKNYTFGLVCVDVVGAPIKHVFGKGSFEPVETFDTLIECDQCFGLEDIPSPIAMNSQVLLLNSEVKSLEQVMMNISREVARLDTVAFPVDESDEVASPVDRRGQAGPNVSTNSSASAADQNVSSGNLGASDGRTEEGKKSKHFFLRRAAPVGGSVESAIGVQRQRLRHGASMRKQSTSNTGVKADMRRRESLEKSRGVGADDQGEVVDESEGDEDEDMSGEMAWSGDADQDEERFGGGYDSPGEEERDYGSQEYGAEGGSED